ncbi:serine dehydratase-like protein, alpha subunit [Thelephora terrestris]|uniref:Serine dehydratase-like protein, alpha subunit n=1 Tax=Thelephora terrestris TaxID=56493 RepID=A0A9P6LAE1_9AGAM|nr:serine dehydratase-like protein, alpha subunit [Thelephora terrestris]
MDDCIRTGVSTSEKTLPGRLGLHHRAPMLGRRLMRGFYPGLAPSSSGDQRIRQTKRESPARRPAARVVGQLDHPAANEVNTAGGRIMTSPTNGASGAIPSVLNHIIEFVSDDPQKSITTFSLTAAAVRMLFKRGSTASAAEGGCQAEV